MANRLLAGAYRVQITPPLGTPLEGTFDFRPARRIADDLYANALVLDDGQVEFALVSIDVCMIPDWIVADIRGGVETRWGIPAANVIVAATHTHSGPVLANLFDHTGQSADPEYIKILSIQVITAIGSAQQRKQPVRVMAGRGENHEHVFNRRLRAPEGDIRMNWIDPQKLQGSVPTGLVDPEVLAIKLIDESGTPVALIVNAANHNNANADEYAISADIAGYMGKTLKQVYGDQTIILFLLGACGNVNWLDHTNPEVRTPTWYQKIALSLTGTILQMEAHLEEIHVESIEVNQALYEIKDRPGRDSDLLPDATFGEDAIHVLDAYRRSRKMDQDRELPVNRVELSALWIGKEVCILCNPAEIFAEIGLEIKSKSPVKYTLISELTNGYAGYIPTRAAFSAGGYEVRKITGGSHLAVDTDQVITSASLDLLSERSNRWAQQPAP